MRSLIFCICVWFSPASILYADYASFDCNKATTVTEKAICADPELSALDNHMAKLYAHARGSTSMGDTYETKQLQWLKNRNKCKSDKQCLLKSYDNILNQLKDFDYEALLLKAITERSHCITKSEDGLNSGVTSKMMASHIDYNDCLEIIVKDLIVSTTTADYDFISENLENLRSSSNFIIYHIYNSKKSCTPLCGSMFRLFPPSNYNDILDKLILDIAHANDVSISFE